MYMDCRVNYFYHYNELIFYMKIVVEREIFDIYRNYCVHATRWYHFDFRLSSCVEDILDLSQKSMV